MDKQAFRRCSAECLSTDIVCLEGGNVSRHHVSYSVKGMSTDCVCVCIGVCICVCVYMCVWWGVGGK